MVVPATKKAAPRKVGTKAVRVWGEVGVTINLGDFNNVKFTFGHERLCADNAEAIARTERIINKMNQEVVSKRVEELSRLVLAKSES